MNICHVCGSNGEIKCHRCPSCVCVRHAKQLAEEVLCNRCYRLTQEAYDEHRTEAN